LSIIAIFVVLLFIESCFYCYDKQFFLWQTNPSWVTKLDKELIYSLQPNKTGYFVQEEFKEKSTINSYGLRDKEIDEYSKYDLRIIVIGDSFTYGYGVNNGQTYSDFLELIFLEQDNRKVDVINAGVHGYGTDQEYKFYTNKLHGKIKHNVLILGVNTNDITDNIGNPLYTIQNNQLRSLDATRTWIYFLTNLYQKSPSIIKQSKTFNFILSRLKGRDIFHLLPKADNAGLKEWSARKISLQIEALNEITRKDNIKFIVVTMPTKSSGSGAYDWLRMEMNNRDVLFVDIAKLPIWGEKRDKLFFKKDSHLNIHGYKVLAQQIYLGIRDFVDPSQ